MTTPNTEWPNPPVPESIKALLKKFYEIGDSKAEDAGTRLGEEIFASTGQIVVNKRKINGTEEIKSSQHGLWGALKSRSHNIHKVYTAGPAGDDLMVFGVVTWTFNDGRVLDGGFATRFIVETGGSDGPRLKLFQGWADLSGLEAALKVDKE